MVTFEIKPKTTAMIKIIGVGGGGNNAVNYMYHQGIQDVDFIVCNTDKQILDRLDIPTKIQLGPELTKGLGAGGNPEIGKKSAEESREEITKILTPLMENGEQGMVFITAGMGGGTGTGAAPIIAEICKKLGMLTIGVVTTPFSHEGKPRLRRAEEGIKQLKQHVDTLIIINNNKLKYHYGKLDVVTALDKANEVLSIGTQSITSIINECGLINVDFADIKTVLKNGGVALIGQATLNTRERENLVSTALASPLLDNNDISDAKKILINICIPDREFSPDFEEIENIMQEIRSAAGISEDNEDDETDIFYGISCNSALEDKIMLTIIATGFKDISHSKKPVKTVLKLDKISIPEPQSDSTTENVNMPNQSKTETTHNTENNEEGSTTTEPVKNTKKEEILIEQQPEEEREKQKDPFQFTVHTKNDNMENNDQEEDYRTYIERGKTERKTKTTLGEQLKTYNTPLPLDFDNPESEAYKNKLIQKFNHIPNPQQFNAINNSELSTTVLKKDKNGNITITKGNKYIDGNHPD